MMPLSMPSPSSADRSRQISSDFIHARALERLYQRRTVVENLIRSLEEYQRRHTPRRAECIEFSARKCSSSSAR